MSISDSSCSQASGRRPHSYLKHSPMTVLNKRVDDWSGEAAEMSLSEYRQAIKARHTSSVADGTRGANRSASR